MEPQKSEVYYQGILKAIELYQRGELELYDLERIPKADLLAAMRQECQRISRVINEKNNSLSFTFLNTQKQNRNN